jgi:hypothetical protein
LFGALKDGGTARVEVTEDGAALAVTAAGLAN